MRTRIPRSHAISSTGLDETTMPMQLALVRHASSTRAQIGIWGRRFDAPLAPGFEDQLANTRSALQHLPAPTVFSSPLARCRETAAHIFPNRDIRIVDELMAYHSGAMETLTEDLIREHHPGYLDRSFRERFLDPAFGEESVAEQAERVAHGLLRVIRESLNSTVIVAHFSSINIIANLVERNFKTSTYADGAYDLRDGEYILLAINPAVVSSDVESFLGLPHSDFHQTGRIAK